MTTATRRNPKSWLVRIFSVVELGLPSATRKAALRDLRRAAQIWDALHDPAADFAYWEIERTAPWLDRESELMLMREPVGVRVRAARIVRDEIGQRPVATSYRKRIPEKYLRDVIARAEERLAVDRPVW